MLGRSFDLSVEKMSKPLVTIDNMVQFMGMLGIYYKGKYKGGRFMGVKVKKLEKNKVSIEVEVGADEVDAALGRAYRQVVKKVNIPGFRKGHVPRKVLEMRLGKGILYEDALEILLPEAYDRAIVEAKLEPIDQPQIEDVHIEEGSPLRFSATVEVKPEVQLGQYKGLKIEKEKVEVTPEDVDDFLHALRERNAVWQVVEEGEVCDGDLVIIDFTGFVNGEPLEGGKGENHTLRIGSGTFIPGFEEQLLGARVDEERKIQVVFPEDYQNEDIAGAEAEFDVKLKEIKRKKLVPIDDEFAKDVSDFASLEELRDDSRKKLLEAAKNKAEEQFRQKVISRVVDNAEVEVPEILIKRRIDSMLGDMELRLQQQGIPLETYLEYSEKTREDMGEELAEPAHLGVKTDLVLNAIALKEGIEAKEEEVEGEFTLLAKGFAGEDDNEEEIIRGLREQGYEKYLSDSIVRRKTLELLMAENQAHPE